MAGLTKKSGLRVAAWQALKACGGTSLTVVLQLRRRDTNQPKKMFLNRVLRWREVHPHHTADAADKTDTKHEPCKM
jgi:hypothetical protein